MATVNVGPMPVSYRSIRRKIFRPRPPPIFDCDGLVTPEDIVLAKALFLELDPESQDWYGGAVGRFADL